MLIVLRRRNVEANLTTTGLLLLRTSGHPRDRTLAQIAPADLDDVATVCRLGHVAHAAGYYAAALDGDRGKLERFAADLGVDLEWLADVASRDLRVHGDEAA